MRSVHQIVREGIARLAERPVQRPRWLRQMSFAVVATLISLVLVIVAWLVVLLTEIVDRSATEKKKQDTTRSSLAPLEMTPPQLPGETGKLLVR